MHQIRTQVGIVGAGPAGLVLGHLLHRAGIESVVLESRSREYCQERVRAGLLEQNTADLLVEMGVGERMKCEGLVHHGINLRFRGRTHRIDFADLTGRHILIYGQGEVIKDLVDARLAFGGPLFFEAENVSVRDFESSRPRILFQNKGEQTELACDFIAGCDGFHGVCRPSIPAGALTVYERDYPFGWLGILAQAPPSSEELIYAYHQRGFALLSMRTPEISRLYIQCTPDEDLRLWPDEKIWRELQVRLSSQEGWKLMEGPVLQKNVTKMHSFVVEPMQYRRLFLAGDAAHIVPPTGAKGLNLAVTDVLMLSRALEAKYRDNKEDLLDRYSEVCLRRVWKAERFSWYMTTMLHRNAQETAFEQRIHFADLDLVRTSRASARSLAENYVGLPFDEG